MKQQRGARQQDHHHRDLGHHDQPARAAPVAGAAAALGLQVLVRVHMDGAQRRRQPEPDAGEKGRRDREEQHRDVDSDLPGPRHGRRAHADEQGHGPVGEQHSDERASEGQEPALEQQLSHEEPRAGAERPADRQLLAPGGRPHQHQVREVGAGDQQQQRHGRRQHPQRPAEAAGELLAVGSDQHAFLPRVAARELLLEPPADAVELGRHLLAARARAGARDHADEVGGLAVVAPRVLVRGERDRKVDVADGEQELRGHHADHGEGLAVQRERAADHLGVAAEAALPESVRQHHDLLVARDVVRGTEGAPERRRDPQHVEEVGGDAQPRDPLRVLVAVQVPAPVREARDALERAGAVAVVAELGQREGIAVGRGVAGVDPVEPLRLGEGQRLEQHRVQDAVERRVGADPERQRHEREQREAGGEGEAAQRVAQVLGDVVHGASERAQASRRPSYGDSSLFSSNA